MRNPEGPSCSSTQDHLLKELSNEFDDTHQAHALLDEFLRHEAYSQRFCLKLIAVARQGTGVPWDIRRLAVLIIEHQLLRLNGNNLDDFDQVSVAGAR